MEGRYRGKPFLILLEKYVLLVIGELSDKDKQAVELMSPKLKETFKKEGSWSEIVAAVMELSSEDAEGVLRSWSKNKVEAQRQGKVADPQVFARAVADLWSGARES